MKKMKKFLVSLVMICCLMAVSPISMQEILNVQTVQAAAKMNKSKAILISGQKIQLKINGTSQKVTWSSSKKNVAVVTSTGKVTAKRKGTATIYAKVGNKKYTCKITVETPKMSKTSLSIKVGDSYKLKLTGTKQKVIWSSNNKNVATVSSKGNVVAKKSGTAKITAKVGNKAYTCNIAIKGSSKKNVSDYYKKLKDYINTYGYTNKYGNNFIKEIYTPSGTDIEVTVAIIYDKSKNVFELLCIQEAFATEIYIKPTNSPTFHVHAEANIDEYEIFNFDSIESSANYYDGDFIYLDGRYNSKLITYNKAINQARSNVNIAFSLSDIVLLKSRIGIGWKQLGFPHFK